MHDFSLLSSELLGPFSLLSYPKDTIELTTLSVFSFYSSVTVYPETMPASLPMVITFCSVNGAPPIASMPEVDPKPVF